MELLRNFIFSSSIHLFNGTSGKKKVSLVPWNKYLIELMEMILHYGAPFQTPLLDNNFVRSTMEDHQQMLRELLGDIAKEHGYEDYTIQIEPTSSGGANYTSVLYNITISAPNKVLYLFAKVANMTEGTRSIAPNFVFDTERFVYKDLAEIFKKIEETCDVPEEERYVFPKVYGYNPIIYEETIILENLAVQGYIVYDRLKSIDWPYASKAVENIAKFHALSMAYGEKYPEDYKDLLKRHTKQMLPIYESMGDHFDSFIETALSVVKKEHKEKLQKYFDREASLSGNIMTRYTKPNRKPVLIHSDFRPSNIMHKINQDGSMDLIILDYQTIQGGCGIADLLYFIFTGSDAQFRARYYQRLLDHYYDSLKRTLLRLRLDPDKIFPREDFEYELQEALPYGLICAVWLLPIITVESDDAPDLNIDFWENFSKPKISSYYPERINDVIDDYVRWGIL